MAKKKKEYDWVIGIDLGNGFVKIRCLNKKTGEKYLVTLPSAWAYKKDVGDDIQNPSLKLDTYYIKDVAYVWGEDIKLLKDIKNTYGHDNRYKTEAFKIMAKIAMAKVVDDLDIKATEKILLVTGVPSGESNTEREKDIAEAFIGDKEGLHEVDVNENEHIFKIAHVEVLSQAVSAVIARYLDEDGYVGDSDYEEDKVGIIDIGAGTMDFDVVDRLRRLKGWHSEPKGFRTVYEYIRVPINRKYPNHPVSDYKLIDCLNSNEYKPSKRKEAVNFEEEKNNAINELVVVMQQSIMEKWNDQTDMDEVLLIGASAREFKDKISNILTGITIPENADSINAEGYYRWGMYLAYVAERDED